MSDSISMQKQPEVPAPSRRRHPRGLSTLALTEMWERFSLYGMVAILVHFLAAKTQSGGMGLSEGTAEAVEGVYMAMIGLLALPGGWVADRLLGARRTVLWGGIVIMAGHIAMSVPGNLGVWPGLFLITIGTGLLKSNISAMVGCLYAEGDERRDAGYSLFYMGINFGALVAPLLVGFLGEEVNWHLGFAAAAVGMAFGLAQYVIGGRRMADTYKEAPITPLTPRERHTLKRNGAIAAAGLLLLGLLGAVTGSLDIDNITFALTLIAVVVPGGYLVYMYRSPSVTTEERKRLKAYVWLFAAAALFWMIYDQVGSELNLFAAQKTNLDVFGWSMPASWTQSIGSVFVILMAPLFAVFWVRRGRNFSTPGKFAAALGLVGISFLLMSAASSLASGGAKVSLMWLIGVYFIQVIGEMCLSPVGLSVTTVLAPRAFTNQMMGVWFLAAATGDAIGGQLPRLDDVIGQSSNFLWQGALLIVAGIAMFLGAGKLRALIGEQRPAATEVTVAA
ncbi:peptide MFS transporter [Streptomyces sp. NBC_01304]|uniref:peptide MFS transporter n=1 Tax=Streptomyces sp. NBC_01304 TaxID=2903818 RepID=UPI002E10A949|nr:oligopeptide:H+ symporter [Streptomyces sp. NBC_01304]